jgi:hypothetical protein
LDSNEVKVAFPQPTEVLTGFGFKFSPGGSHISRTMMLHELEQYAFALVDAIEAIEEHLRVLGFEPIDSSARRASRESKPYTPQWTRYTRPTRRSGVSRSWRANCLRE